MLARNWAAISVLRTCLMLNKNISSCGYAWEAEVRNSKFKASLVLHSKVQANQGSVVTLYENKNNEELISSVVKSEERTLSLGHSDYWLLFIVKNSR